ncbi:MAG: hypothetical protein Q8K96_04795 [Rubrivivax sp.]|nr:hypothetical protein [Rubrivivax sp.]
MKPTALLLALILPTLALAQTQTPWRCGSDGRSYSDKPCAEGHPLEVAAARPVADVNAARQLAERERRLADSLRKERHEREAQAAGAGLARPVAPRAVAVKPMAESPRRPKHRAKPKPTEAEEIWRAVVPATRRARG